MTSYFEVVKYLLGTYATDDVIAKIGAKILHFTQLSNMTPTEYVEMLSNKALRCDRVYDEYFFKEKFLEGLHGDSPYSMRSKWSLKKNATDYDLERHVTSLINLEHGWRSLKHSSQYN